MTNGITTNCIGRTACSHTGTATYTHASGGKVCLGQAPLSSPPSSSGSDHSGQGESEELRLEICTVKRRPFVKRRHFTVGFCRTLSKGPWFSSLPRGGVGAGVIGRGEGCPQRVRFGPLCIITSPPSQSARPYAVHMANLHPKHASPAILPFQILLKK